MTHKEGREDEVKTTLQGTMQGRSSALRRSQLATHTRAAGVWSGE
jgi:hypothetical protein